MISAKRITINSTPFSAALVYIPNTFVTMDTLVAMIQWDTTSLNRNFDWKANSKVIHFLYFQQQQQQHPPFIPPEWAAADLHGINPAPWTSEEQKLLEQALKTYPSSTPERWDRIASTIPNRSKRDCMKRFKKIPSKDTKEMYSLIQRQWHQLVPEGSATNFPIAMQEAGVTLQFLKKSYNFVSYTMVCYWGGSPFNGTAINTDGAGRKWCGMSALKKEDSKSLDRAIALKLPGQVFTIATKRQSEQNVAFFPVHMKCPSHYTGLVADITDEHYFIICEKGIFIRKSKCPEGSIFHQVMRSCNKALTTTNSITISKDSTTPTGFISSTKEPSEDQIRNTRTTTNASLKEIMPEQKTEILLITTKIPPTNVNACPPNYNGLAADVTNEHYFLICNNGIFIRRSKCPEGSIYYQDISSCHKTVTAKPIEFTINSRTKFPISTLSTSTETRLPIKINTISTKSFSPDITRSEKAKEILHITTKNPTTRSPQCRRGYTGLAADITDEHYFLICSNGIFIRRSKCPKGTIFHEVIRSCNKLITIKPKTTIKASTKGSISTLITKMSTKEPIKISSISTKPSSPSTTMSGKTSEKFQASTKASTSTLITKTSSKEPIKISSISTKPSSPDTTMSGKTTEKFQITTRIPTTRSPKCPPGYTGLAADITDEHYFLICSTGIFIRRSKCPKGTIFHQGIRSCNELTTSKAKTTMKASTKASTSTLITKTSSKEPIKISSISTKPSSPDTTMSGKTTEKIQASTKASTSTLITKTSSKEPIKISSISAKPSSPSTTMSGKTSEKFQASTKASTSTLITKTSSKEPIKISSISTKPSSPSTTMSGKTSEKFQASTKASTSTVITKTSSKEPIKISSISTKPSSPDTTMSGKTTEKFQITTRIPTTRSPKCPPGYTGLAADITDEHYFLICSTGIFIRRSKCPKGTIFHQGIRSCNELTTSKAKTTMKASTKASTSTLITKTSSKEPIKISSISTKPSSPDTTMSGKTTEKIQASTKASTSTLIAKTSSKEPIKISSISTKPSSPDTTMSGKTTEKIQASTKASTSTLITKTSSKEPIKISSISTKPSSPDTTMSRKTTEKFQASTKASTSTLITKTSSKEPMKISSISTKLSSPDTTMSRKTTEKFQASTKASTSTLITKTSSKEPMKISSISTKPSSPDTTMSRKTTEKFQASTKASTSTLITKTSSKEPIKISSISTKPSSPSTTMSGKTSEKFQASTKASTSTLITKTSSKEPIKISSISTKPSSPDTTMSGKTTEKFQITTRIPTTRSPKCPPGYTGLAADITDEHYFLICSTGIFIRRSKCPKGTIFHQGIRSCNELTTSKAKTTMKASTKASTSTLITKTSSKEPIKISSISTKPSSPDTTRTEKTTEKVHITSKIPTTRSPKCPPGYTGLAADITDVHYFLICSNGTLIRRAKCPEGSVFYQGLKSCNKISTMTKSVTSILHITSPIETFKTSPEPLSSSSEVEVSKATQQPISTHTLHTHSLTTPTSEIPIFNVTSTHSTIALPSSTKKSVTTVTLSTQSTSHMTTEPTIAKSKCYQGRSRKIADKADCSSYYSCENGFYVLKNCSKGDLFDWKSLKCVSAAYARCPAQVRCLKDDCLQAAADPDYCQRFFFCKNGKPHFKTCPSYLLFNPRTGTCDYRCRVRCITRPHNMAPSTENAGCIFDSNIEVKEPNCPKKDGNFALNSDCRRYVVCNNWKAKFAE
ncbi:hypothetical protein GQR58_019020 [Nymphon striatum]|nr:hypothetical protein GQR58_019020 [Nymphon striatum]